MGAFINITGQKFRRLTAVRFSHRKKDKYYWLFYCDCGKEKIILKSHVVGYLTKSCGCYNKERSRERGKRNRIHGMFGTRFYNVWIQIIKRTTNPKNQAYKNYGGRGIKICKRWLKFINFRNDMYKSYLKHVEEFRERQTTIDRINNN